MRWNWGIYVIILLLAINASVFTTFLIRQKKLTERQQSVRIEPDSKKKKRTHHNGFRDMLHEDLKMSDEQINEIEELRHHHFDLMHRQMDDIHTIRDEFFKELAKGKPDTIILHELANKFGKKQTDKLYKMYQHYLDIRGVCTPEQALKMDSISQVVWKHEHFGKRKHKHEKHREK